MNALPAIASNTPTAEVWIAWVRFRGHDWQEVARGATSAEADKTISVFLGALPYVPKHIESYVGRHGNPPPMGKRP